MAGVHDVGLGEVVEPEAVRVKQRRDVPGGEREVDRLTEEAHRPFGEEPQRAAGAGNLLPEVHGQHRAGAAELGERGERALRRGAGEVHADALPHDRGRRPGGVAGIGEPVGQDVDVENLASRKYPNGITNLYQYDARNRLTNEI